MDLSRVTEGRTAFLVPCQDPSLPFPPGGAPIFYNPRMEYSRDATVLFLQATPVNDYLDAMGATGARGLRVSSECGVPVAINDRDSRAAALARENATALGLPIEVLEEDVNVLLSRRKFDAVDLDPFGTPAPFVDAAARSARRFLFVTATDTAPLCGAHLKAGMRRYFAKPMNTEYHGEVALRILLAFVAREVVKYDRGIEPLFCFSHEHFVRLHLAIADGAKAGDRTIGRIGFVLQCPSCVYREEEQGLVSRGGTCPDCGAVLSPVGPLWIGAVNDTPTLTGMEERLATAELRSKQSIAKLLAGLRGELDTSTFYDYHRIARSIGASPPPIDAVVARVRARGYRAGRTHYSGTGIKTDAPVEELMRAVGAGEDTSPTC